MKQATPYLNFAGQTEEAFAFYRSVFGGETPPAIRYRDMGMDGADGDLVAHVALHVAGRVVLMGSDVASSRVGDHVVGTNVEIHVEADDAREARRLFDALAAGGTVSMPLEKVSWSELFGACVDRFGVHWMVDYAGEVQFGAS